MAANIDQAITLPAGASGFSLQLTAGTVYWSFTQMTDVDQGFKLSSKKTEVWLHPAQTPLLYLYGSGTVLHQPLAPSAY